MLSEERVVSLRDLLPILKRRRSLVFWVTGAAMAGVILVCLLSTRRYTAASEIELQSNIPGGLDVNTLNGGPGDAVSDAVSINLDLQTQASLLESEELAIRVIKELNLEQNEDFKAHFNPLSVVLGLFESNDAKESPALDIAKSPRRRARATNTFEKRLKVKVVAGTRLLQVSYSNPDPTTAANVTNRLIKELVDYQFQTRTDAMKEASGWLGGQLDELRNRSEMLQAHVVQVQRQTGIFGMPGADLEGKPTIYSPVLDRLQQATAALSQAQMNRVLKGAVYDVVKTGDAELISQLSGTSEAGTGNSGVMTSLALIQALRTQEASLRAQIALDSTAFGPAYPKLMEERASLERLQSSIREEVARMATRARNDFDVAVRTDAGAQKTYDTQRAEAAKLNDKTITYSILQREASQSEDLYQDLLKHLKEAGIFQGLRSTNISVVGAATPPARPSSPNVLLYLSLGIVMGPLLGAAWALVVDTLDDTIRDSEGIERSQIFSLGDVPTVEGALNGVSADILNHDRFAFSEAIRSLRTSVSIAHEDGCAKLLLFTSPGQGEGKSTLALSLAASFAQQARRVLFIEANLRTPVVHGWLNLPPAPGLGDLLGGIDCEPREVIGQANLYILPAGKSSLPPADVLSSKQMGSALSSWRSDFDFVIIEAPSVLQYADTRILSQAADLTILVVRAKVTKYQDLSKSLRLVAQHSRSRTAEAVAVVVNSV